MPNTHGACDREHNSAAVLAGGSLLSTNEFPPAETHHSSEPEVLVLLYVSNQTSCSMKNITNKLHTWSCLTDGEQQLPYCSIRHCRCRGEGRGALAPPDRLWAEEHAAAACLQLRNGNLKRRCISTSRGVSEAAQISTIFHQILCISSLKLLLNFRFILLFGAST